MNAIIRKLKKMTYPYEFKQNITPNEKYYSFLSFSDDP